MMYFPRISRERSTFILKDRWPDDRGDSRLSEWEGEHFSHHVGCQCLACPTEIIFFPCFLPSPLNTCLLALPPRFHPGSNFPTFPKRCQVSLYLCLKNIKCQAYFLFFTSPRLLIVSNSKYQLLKLIHATPPTQVSVVLETATLLEMISQSH